MKSICDFIFQLNTDGIQAYGMVRADGMFQVLKGASLPIQILSNHQKSELRDTGAVYKRSDRFEFEHDYAFCTPGQATTVFLDKLEPDLWKTPQGKTFSEIETYCDVLSSL
jgi:hypothetical protein